MSNFCLADLDAIIAARASATAEASYTKSLLDAGPSRIAKKLGEEAVELAIAAVEGERGAITRESADLLYHLLVLLHSQAIPLQDVLAELAERTGRSGHAEKAARDS
ncbi:MAG: phosphoribosyl-ATP diphosphatase [Beijerinckiaceae bacterium]